MRSVLISAMLALLLCGTAVSGELEGVTLPDTLDVDDSPLVLNGMAQRSVVWFDVYVAGLYLAQKSDDGPTVLAMDGAKRMDMVFQRDVSAEDICDAWKKGFKKNAENKGEEQLARLEELCAVSPDLVEGDTTAYVYSPSTDSTDFIMNSELKHTTPGRDFYTALLSCWIGPKPGPGKRFKKGVLGVD